MRKEVEKKQRIIKHKVNKERKEGKKGRNVELVKKRIEIKIETSGTDKGVKRRL